MNESLGTSWCSRYSFFSYSPHRPHFVFSSDCFLIFFKSFKLFFHLINFAFVFVSLDFFSSVFLCVRPHFIPLFKGEYFASIYWCCSTAKKRKEKVMNSSLLFIVFVVHDNRKRKFAFLSIENRCLFVALFCHSKWKASKLAYKPFFIWKLHFNTKKMLVVLLIRISSWRRNLLCFMPSFALNDMINL